MNAIDILTKYFPDENHILIDDNATTHRKRAEDVLSARRMPKKMARSGESCHR